MTAGCRPYVQPSQAGPVHRWVARCDVCGLFEEFVSELEAQRRVEDHENGADR